MKENKEQTKKNPWRFAFLACGVYGAVKLLGGLWVNIVYWFSVLFMEIRSEFVPNEAYSVGIIGVLTALRRFLSPHRCGYPT